MVQVGDVLTIDIRDRLMRVRVLRIPQRIEGPEGVVEVLPEEVGE
ncbi:RNA-binding S4 domain-containing protein, partial [Acidithiobacillus ferriphilus]|nr:RNA-binding S4 domain-containing protein [Acidithiobacillus ferriphilus]